MVIMLVVGLGINMAGWQGKGAGLPADTPCSLLLPLTSGNKAQHSIRQHCQMAIFSDAGMMCVQDTCMACVLATCLISVPDRV